MAQASPTTSTFVSFKPRSTSMNPRSPMRTDKAHAGNKFHRGKFIFCSAKKQRAPARKNRTDAPGARLGGVSWGRVSDGMAAGLLRCRLGHPVEKISEPG